MPRAVNRKLKTSSSALRVAFLAFMKRGRSWRSTKVTSRFGSTYSQSWARVRARSPVGAASVNTLAMAACMGKSKSESTTNHAVETGFAPLEEGDHPRVGVKYLAYHAEGRILLADGRRPLPPKPPRHIRQRVLANAVDAGSSPSHGKRLEQIERIVSSPVLQNSEALCALPKFLLR